MVLVGRFSRGVNLVAVPTMTSTRRVFFSDGSLPVILSSFTATASDGKVTLLWRTESEVNNVGSYVYRSDNNDGKYTKVNAGRIPGAGTDSTQHNYYFTDEFEFPIRIIIWNSSADKNSLILFQNKIFLLANGGSL